MPEPLQALRAVVVKRPPRRERSSTENSRDNIAHHYDLSNDLFELFLDPTLSYSSAQVPRATCSAARPGARTSRPRSTRKIDRLLDQAGVGEGTRLLEIGTGWGELAIRAARRGATVRTITLSVEQKDAGRPADRRRPAVADRVVGRAVRLPRTSATPASSTTPSCRWR